MAFPEERRGRRVASLGGVSIVDEIGRDRRRRDGVNTGTARRTARVFGADGRSLVVAFDHGIGGANHGGMAVPGRTLDELIGAGADAVLATVGLAHQFQEKLARVGLVINLDLCTGHEEVAVREATLLGADMGKFIFTPWSKDVPDSLARTAHVVAVAHDYGFPLMIEPIPVSFEQTDAHTAENIGQAAKMACEVGADVVKMQYTGDPASFQQIMSTLYRPVVILGGPSRNDDRGLLQMVRDTLDAGAVGITIGRNIWGHERPGHMVGAMAALIHEDASVDVAMRQLEPAFAVA
jgi:DhnA family fructose-bisphosphate aldolase class Ia